MAWNTVEFRIQQDEPEGMFIISLYSNRKFVKNVAECYEEDYAFQVAKALATNSGARFDGLVYTSYE